MAVYDCQSCGYTYGNANHKHAEVEDPVTQDIRDGLFPACTRCESIDVDVYSDEGWQIELRVRDVLERNHGKRLNAHAWFRAT